jgi:hypothetical protein
VLLGLQIGRLCALKPVNRSIGERRSSESRLSERKTLSIGLNARLIARLIARLNAVAPLVPIGEKEGPVSPGFQSAKLSQSV